MIIVELSFILTYNMSVGRIIKLATLQGKSHFKAILNYFIIADLVK